jgi:hypothetical protein
VSGVPRLPMLGGDQALSTEVISTYTFDSQGKIYEHQVGCYVLYMRGIAVLCQLRNFGTVLCRHALCQQLL